MYVVIEHEIQDPQKFWTGAQELIPKNLPPGLVLHQSFPAPDGIRAICVWEAESIAALREFMEPHLGQASTNRYYQVENREGVAVPAAFAIAAEPV